MKKKGLDKNIFSLTLIFEKKTTSDNETKKIKSAQGHPEA